MAVEMGGCQNYTQKGAIILTTTQIRKGSRRLSVGLNFLEQYVLFEPEGNLSLATLRVTVRMVLLKVLMPGVGKGFATSLQKKPIPERGTS